jgi:ADP-heptose:LPS heptosyltransferase
MDAMFGRDTPAPRKILFLKLTEMGATVLARAAFDRAIAKVGRENVYLLTLEENRALTELIGLIPRENILSVRRESPFLFLRDAAARLRQIRRLKIDTTVDLEFFMRASALIGYMSGARLRVGIHRFNWEAPYRGDLLTHRLQYNPHIHTAQLYDALVRAIDETPGVCPLGKFGPDPAALAPPRIAPTESERAAVREKLERIAGRALDRPIVLFNPNCNDVLPMRKWPIENYEALARQILLRHGSATIFCIGLEVDAGPLAELCRQVDAQRMFSLAGKTDFRELLTLFTLCDVLVSADSGPPHFAAMTDIETVVLFGPETPSLFGPLGTRAHVLSARFVCSPCVNPLNSRISPCDTNECMQAIPPERVMNVVDECLARQRSGIAADCTEA